MALGTPKIPSLITLIPMVSTRQATSWKARQASVPERPGFGSSENGGIMTSVEMAIQHH